MYSRQDPFGKKMFDEKRKIACISKYTNLSKNHWYTTWETTSTEYVYSEIDLVDDTDSYVFPNGKTALLIGVNPRQTADDYTKEVKDYLNARNYNPGIKNRKSLADKKEDSLEPFRRIALRELLEKNASGDGIKKLVIVDLFAHRTKNAKELNIIKKINKSKKLDDEKKREEIEKIIGKKNKENLKNLISSDDIDIIFLGWGGIISILEPLPDYCRFLFDLLNDNISKVWWLGNNSDGSPKHCSGGIKRGSLKQITESELKKALLEE